MSADRGKRPLRIVAASTNRAKRAKLQDLAGRAGLVVGPPRDISPELRQELARSEEAGSVARNARAKALAWSRALPGELVAVTDGGLLVPGLGNRWKPERTRRFAGESASDEGRARALLALAAGLTGDQRQISWREALVLARDGRVIGQWIAESTDGVLAAEVDPALIQAGDGFWIPAIWLCPNAGGQPLATLSAADQAVCQDHWTKLGVPFRRALRTVAKQQP
jgi:inosine/xanthosine triphosphate pyrophosphatase family protein